MHLRIARVLAPDMTCDEMEQACVDDWRSDLRGGERMTFQRYVLSIFEIADLWTDSLNELDYVTLINKLFRRVTKPLTSVEQLARVFRSSANTSTGSTPLSALGR